jgi:hypothetical protein
MKIIKITSLIIIVLATFSCNKDKKDNTVVTPDKKVSWWAMDKDTFRTTESKLHINGSSFSIHYESSTNDTAFNIEIDTANRNLNNDSFAIFGIYHGNSLVGGYFNEKGASYAVGPNDSGTCIYSTVEDGKIKLTLPPTIYHRVVPASGGGYTTSPDTTIVQGVFYAP